MAIKDKMSERVAQAIKDRREQLGLSLRALATRSNVSTSMISDVERGAKSPTITTLFALAQALEVPVSALVENTGQQYGRIHVVRASERPEVVDPSSGGTRDSGASDLRNDIRAVGNQAAARGPITERIDRGQSMTGRQRDNQLAMNHP